jgi:hypothetical protein
MRHIRLLALAGLISFAALVAVALFGGTTPKTGAGDQPTPPAPKIEGFICGSADVLGIPEGAKTYQLDCRDYPADVKEPLIVDQNLTITVKTGIPFECRAGRGTLSVGPRGEVSNYPIGRGFQGIIGETAKGAPVLDITFEDMQGFGPAPGGGTQVEGKVTRWVKTDFVTKPLRFVVRGEKGEARWGVALSFSGPTGVWRGGKESKEGSRTSANRDERLERKVDTALEKLERIERALDRLQRSR